MRRNIQPVLFLRRSCETLRQTFQPSQMAMMLILGLIFSLLLYAILQLAVPYRPMSVYDYEALPKAACPNEKVRVWVDSEVRGHLRRLNVEYSWSPAGLSGDTFGGEVDLYDIEPYEREVIRSSIVRQTPTEPGRWQLITDYEAYGSRWGAPVRQDLTLTSEKLVTVLPEESERCQ